MCIHVSSTCEFVVPPGTGNHWFSGVYFVRNENLIWTSVLLNILQQPGCWLLTKRWGLSFLLTGDSGFPSYVVDRILWTIPFLPYRDPIPFWEWCWNWNLNTMVFVSVIRQPNHIIWEYDDWCQDTPGFLGDISILIHIKYALIFDVICWCRFDKYTSRGLRLRTALTRGFGRVHMVHVVFMEEIWFVCFLLGMLRLHWSWAWWVVGHLSKPVQWCVFFWTEIRFLWINHQLWETLRKVSIQYTTVTISDGLSSKLGSLQGGPWAVK